MTDPQARAAQGAAQLAQVVRREASVRAYNDVFMVIVALAMAFLAWSLYRVRRAATEARRAKAAAASATASAAGPPASAAAAL